MAGMAAVLAVSGWTLPAGAQSSGTNSADGSNAAIDVVTSQLDFADGAVEQAVSELEASQRRLDTMKDRLAAAQEQLADAERAARASASAAEQTRREARDVSKDLARSRDELASNQTRLREVARETYKYGLVATDPDLAVLGLVARAQSPGDLAHVYHQLDAALDDRADLAAAADRRLRAVAHLRAVADRADEAQQAELDVSLEARSEAARLHTEVERLVEEALDEEDRQAALLEALRGDRDQLRQRLTQLEQARARAQAEAARRAAAAAEAERAARAAQRGGAASGGAAAPRGAASPVEAQGDGLAKVEGITVATELAPRLAQLLADARADGIVLGGWGWRSVERQKALRRINGCPDIYSSPASSCRVPTARPGQSQHNKGLAVDFTWKGETLCYPMGPASCRGTNAAFDWLEANAHNYGLKVLSSEAWHWSTTGR